MVGGVLAADAGSSDVVLDVNPNMNLDLNLSDPAVAVDVRVKKAKALAHDKRPKAIDVLLTGLDSRSEELRVAIIAPLKALTGDVVLLQRAADSKRTPAERVACSLMHAMASADSGQPGAAGVKQRFGSIASGVQR